MAKPDFSARINSLLAAESWNEAQRLLLSRQKREPKSHWIVTQLAVTYYEQRKYAEAYKLLLKSIQLVRDCPLTLWNLAGTCDALGKSNEAMQIYAWLIRSNKTAADDSCWENDAWTAALKADSVFRVSSILEENGLSDAARKGYLLYLDQLGTGVDGVYSFDEVRRRLARLPDDQDRSRAFDSMLTSAGLGKKRGSVNPPVPKLKLLDTLAGTASVE